MKITKIRLECQQKICWTQSHLLVYVLPVAAFTLHTTAEVSSCDRPSGPQSLKYLLSDSTESICLRLWNRRHFLHSILVAGMS